MKRKATILLTLTGLLMGMVLTPTARASAAAAILKSVTLSASPTGTELVLCVDGTYSYKTIQASPSTLFIDLAGAKVEGVIGNQRWANPAFSGYNLLPYRDTSGQWGIRVQVDTKQAQPFVVQKDGPRLRLLYGKSQPPGAAASRAPIRLPEGISARLEAPGWPTAPLLVSKLYLEKHDSGETFVDIPTSRSASYHVMRVFGPERLVVDFDDAHITSTQMHYPADTPVLKSVRIAQFTAKNPAVVRVVADQNENAAFAVHAIDGAVRIELRPREAMMKPAPLGSKVPATSARPAVDRTVENASATHLRTVDSKVAVLLPMTRVVDPRPAVVPPPTSESQQSVQSDGQNILPMIDDSRQVVAAPLPAFPSSATPEALRAGHAAQILGPGKDDSAAAAQGLPAANAMPAVDSKPMYTGEPISLNLKDVDLKDFFRLIHEISGLNIILDPNISGSVTLVLDSVPWDQALDIVLKNERLGKVMEGNVLRIAKVETLTAEQEGQMKLASARMDAAPLVTVFRPINYAKAAEIASVLKTWVGGGALSRRGTVLVDTRGNTLIISDVQTQMPTVMDIISKMDRKAKQVSIEARVVLANADFSRVLSAALLGGFKNNSTVATSTTGATNGSISIPVPTASQPFPITTATSAAASGFGVASIVNVGANYFINAAISAAEQRDQAKTISRPSIVTQNNVQGMVQQGVQVPIQTTINNTVSVQYFNATLQLQVTPQVTDDNHIFLIINVQNNSVGASISGVGPEIATQQATTQVLVPDGGTVIFGGITVTTRSKAATYIPLLGNIPILGHLFKSSNVSDEDQELLFFVSPKLLIT